MRRFIQIAVAHILFITSVQPSIAVRSDALGAGGVFSATISRIAFGSCSDQRRPQPILKRIIEQDPDLFIYLGDNIYGDSAFPEVLEYKYRQLEAIPEFRKLWNMTNIIATWDDHDFGGNNEGKNFLIKDASQSLFLDFWREPLYSDRFNRKGVYADYMFGDVDKRIQVLLLDTRYFRDDLIRKYHRTKAPGKSAKFSAKYARHDNQSKTLLGRQQWRWLSEQLRKPAKLRIIASSTQFSSSHTGMEAWANFPHEQERMQRMIAESEAEHVIFISGDRHYAEISRMDRKSSYPLYDFTSSGINRSTSLAAENTNRVDGPIMENNFGLLDVNWEERLLKFRVIDEQGREQLHRVVEFNELKR